MNQTKTSYFSTTTDSSNVQGLEKMNPMTVRAFDMNLQKVISKFLDMCKQMTFSGPLTIECLIAMFHGLIAMFHGIDVFRWLWTTPFDVGRHNPVILKLTKKNENMLSLAPQVLALQSYLWTSFFTLTIH